AADRRPAGARTRGELAVVQAHPVQIAVEVARYGVIAVHRDARQVAAHQRRLLPGGHATAAIDRPDRAARIAHQHLVDGQADAVGTTTFAGPDRAPTRTIDGEGLVLVAAGVQDGAVKHRRAVDIGHAVELGPAIGLTDRQ